MRIICVDGIINTVKVLDDNGGEMHNVTKIELIPITTKTGFIEVKLTFQKVQLDIKAKEKEG